MHWCSFASFLLWLIVSVVNTRDNVCPGYGFIRPPENCNSTCSPEKDECPLDKKCCFRIEQPCGFHCIVPKLNEQKPGKCPATSSALDNLEWSLCDGRQCDVDNDCKNTEKCCQNLCGSLICIAPQ